MDERDLLTKKHNRKNEQHEVKQTVQRTEDKPKNFMIIDESTTNNEEKFEKPYWFSHLSPLKLLSSTSAYLFVIDQFLNEKLCNNKQ